MLNAYPVGKEVRVFPAAIGERQARYLAVLGDGPAAGIMGELREKPGSRLVDLSEALGVSRKVIRRHLTILDSEGLVVRSGESRPRYALQPGGGSSLVPSNEQATPGEPGREPRPELGWS